jgi:hypothetical protein
MTAKLEGVPRKLYLMVDDVPWRVHDADFHDFKVIRRQLGDPARHSPGTSFRSTGPVGSTSSRRTMTTGWNSQPWRVN